MDPLCQGVQSLLALPHREQASAVEALLHALSDEGGEDWNTSFGADSLFAAWTRTRVMQDVYAANAAVLRPWLDARTDWRVIEVGAGDGRLWRQVFRPDDVGELVVIDPVAEAVEAVRAVVPPGVQVTELVARVEEAVLPDADALVCSLTLHHVAGRDQIARARAGLLGPGKLEVLQGFREALTPRGGRLVLNEADVHCDLELESGSEVLQQRLLDSYVRRCGRAMIDDLRDRPDAPEAPRWRAILRRWCLEQLRLFAVPVDQRDVYELDVARWLALLDAAGFAPPASRFTDRYGLFVQYVTTPAGSAMRAGRPAGG